MIKDNNLRSKDEEMDVISLIIKQLGLQDRTVLVSTKNQAKGRTLTQLEYRIIVWVFWHSYSSASTLTSRPAKLKLSDKPDLSCEKN